MSLIELKTKCKKCKKPMSKLEVNAKFVLICTNWLCKNHTPEPIQAQLIKKMEAAN